MAKYHYDPVAFDPGNHLCCITNLIPYALVTGSNSHIVQAIGADAAGWLHQGMANRLMLDMGFNLDAASLIGSDQLKQEEVELRRRIYWSLYCVDKLSASYTGRVCTVLVSLSSEHHISQHVYCPVSRFSYLTCAIRILKELLLCHLRTLGLEIALQLI